MIGIVPETSTRKVTVEQDYQKLVEGLKVIKVGRRGKTRDVIIYLTSNHTELVWKSQYFGYKFGRLNSGTYNYEMVDD